MQPRGDAASILGQRMPNIWVSRHHIDSCLCESAGLGSKYLASNTYGNTFPPLPGYITSLLPSNSQTISCFKTSVLTTCVPLLRPSSSAASCCCCGILSILRKVNTTSLHPIFSAHVTPLTTMFALANPLLQHKRFTRSQRNTCQRVVVQVHIECVFKF